MSSRPHTLLIIALSLIPAIAEPPGIDQQLEFLTNQNGKPVIRWTAKPGRTYFIQASDPARPLVIWRTAPFIETGVGQTITHELAEPPAGFPANGFFRLAYTDRPLAPGETPESADYDGDGISNYFETQAGTDPMCADTDGDGIPDGDDDDPLAPHHADLYSAQTLSIWSPRQ